MMGNWIGKKRKKNKGKWRGSKSKIQHEPCVWDTFNESLVSYEWEVMAAKYNLLDYVMA